MPRVLICGAGVAGNALAFWLSRLNYDITVVERFPELRVNGLQIDLRGNGIVVVKNMGIDATVREKCVPELGIEFVDTHGTQWAFMPANTSGKGAQLFTSEYEIMRGDLCRILYDATRPGVNYKFGTSLTHISDESDDQPVKVQFADGTTGEYDLVVGADGQASRTRRLMLGPDTPDPLFSLHQHIAYMRLPSEMGENETFTATAYIAPKGKFVMTRRNNRHELQVYLMGGSKALAARLDEIKRGDLDAEKQAFIDEFRGSGWKVDEILALVRGSNDFYCEREGYVKLDAWSRGRVTLLGDAAHSSAANGYGTSCALIGAYMLAGELMRNVGEKDESKGIKDALAAYEAKLRPLIDSEQKGLGEKSFFDDLEVKAWHIRIIHWLMWVASALKVWRIAQILPDRGTRWDMPEYPELKALCK